MSTPVYLITKEGVLLHTETVGAHTHLVVEDHSRVATQFKVGGSVVHPAHGVGIVTEVKDMVISGRMNRYYIIEFPLTELDRVMIPIENAENLGLRGIDQDLRVLRSAGPNSPPRRNILTGIVSLQVEVRAGSRQARIVSAIGSSILAKRSEGSK